MQHNPNTALHTRYTTTGWRTGKNVNGEGWDSGQHMRVSAKSPTTTSEETGQGGGGTAKYQKCPKSGHTPLSIYYFDLLLFSLRYAAHRVELPKSGRYCDRRAFILPPTAGRESPSYGAERGVYQMVNSMAPRTYDYAATNTQTHHLPVYKSGCA